MLCPFVLSPGCGRPLPALDTAAAISKVEELRAAWSAAGVLVVDRDNALPVALSQEWASQPVGVRKRWQDMFLELREQIAEDTSWALAESELSGGDPSRPARGAFLVHPQECGRWSIAGDDPRRMTTGEIEICRFDCLACSQLEASARRGARMFARKTPTHDVLDAFRLLPLLASRALIIDHYCGKEEVVKPGRSGLVQFLRGVLGAECLGRVRLRVVEVLTASNVPWSAKRADLVTPKELEQAWSAVAPELLSLGIGELQIHLIDSSRFLVITHDRYLLTGRLAFQLGAGFAAFEGAGLSRATTVSRVDAADVRMLVAELKGEGSLKTVTFSKSSRRSCATDGPVIRRPHSDSLEAGGGQGR